jgi:hypothetical protein
MGECDRKESLSTVGAAEANREMIIDQWNPGERRYRSETFCHDPRSCPLYQSGPPRKVPGRHGMTYMEED